MKKDRDGLTLLFPLSILVLVLLIARCSVQSDVDKCEDKGAEYVGTGQLQGVCVKDGLIIP